VIFQAETSKWISEITHPTLLMHGKQDRTAPLENVKNHLNSTCPAKLTN
jgi:pimeloyl-ACP methyl ester carboxylesterase